MSRNEFPTNQFMELSEEITMIEEIKLLLPLIENIADGGMWLIAAYLGINVFKFVIIMAVLSFIAHLVFRSVARISYAFDLYRKLSLELGLETSKFDIYDSDKRAVLETIRRLQAKK